MTSREPKETDSTEIVRGPPPVSGSKTFKGRSCALTCTGIKARSPFAMSFPA
jgi:hypothetical protein